MKDAIEYLEIGECKVIHSIALKKWNLLCRVTKFHDKYKLIELTPKGKCKLKVVIRKEDAEWLIETMNLRCVNNRLLKNSYTYLIV